MGATRGFLIAAMLAISVAGFPSFAEARLLSPVPAPSSNGPSFSIDEESKSIKQEHTEVEEEKIMGVIVPLLFWGAAQQSQTDVLESSAPLIQASSFSWKRVLVLGLVLFYGF
ncbi:uncharacterized protein LOC111906377 [Lactuca sativa]|uniref:uncharacterized protein LOC111906377 n=1 Tax=Lactuca sativa TaxID=4236 RepID=UPI000CC4557E|nr:uncharacterized protein LOC111906377 [Lactuca sativa]